MGNKLAAMRASRDKVERALYARVVRAAEFGDGTTAAGGGAGGAPGGGLVGVLAEATALAQAVGDRVGRGTPASGQRWMGTRQAAGAGEAGGAGRGRLPAPRCRWSRRCAWRVDDVTRGGLLSFSGPATLLRSKHHASETKKKN
eukprot:TRINITY_DN14322_c0_g1_i1.p4 TRINITY_DN14322_c0_g1~~TRINITY_DN14322_c0_g1_i1.p4  ORF type:complete len:144 (+),score=17.12 TRINITY_DN14322_c0_g1_i1:739-1170(+)